MTETLDFNLSQESPLQSVLAAQGDFLSQVRMRPTLLEVGPADCKRVHDALLIAPMPWLTFSESKELEAGTARLSATDD